MVQLKKEQIIFVVSKYLKTKSYVAVTVSFRERFQERNPPCKSSMAKLVKKFKDHGTTLNLNKEFSGRRRTVRTLGEPLKVISAIREMRRRANFCINNNGRHIEGEF